MCINYVIMCECEHALCAGLYYVRSLMHALIHGGSLMNDLNLETSMVVH